MTNRHRVAYVLIGLGAITLLARLSDGAGWLWIGLVAAAMLYAYARQRTYGLLVLGGVLAGTAVGILLQEVFRAEALFLVSLGAGIAAIDLIEPRPNRWPRTLGAVLAAIGVVIGLAQSGAFASVWFALLLIAVGIAIIARGSGTSSFPPPRTSDSTASATPPAGHGAPGAGPGAPGAPSPTTPTPAEPEPAAPTPAEPEPTTPTPAEPEPAAPTPAEPEPATPEPVTYPPGTNAPGTAALGTDAPGTDAPASDVAARRASLEAWRERTAALEARSPQSILSDDVLDELASRAPHDLNALADVRGIGPVKLERYGDALLETLRISRP